MKPPTSPQFQKWFKGSVMVNPDGTPQVWYHGTGGDFDTFDPRFDDSEMGERVAGFFTLRPDTASAYAIHKGKFKELDGEYKDGSSRNAKGGSVIPVYLSLRKVWDYENEGDVLYLDNELEKTGNINRASIRELRSGNYEEIEGPDIADILKEAGYDGLYVHENGGKNVAVFDPRRIKAALGNVSFDPDKESYKESRGIALRVLRLCGLNEASQEDTEYMDAVRAEDVPTMQRLVDARASKEGYEIGPLWHGTPASFDSFHPWSHFGTREQAEHRVRIYPNPPRYLKVYLRITNPLRTRDIGDWDSAGEVMTELETMFQGTGWEEDMEELREEVNKIIEYKGPFRPRAEVKGLIRIQYWLQNVLGHDGIVYENLEEGSGDSYIAFEPEQIKIADPVVYDKGKVVPLSKRFNAFSKRVCESG